MFRQEKTRWREPAGFLGMHVACLVRLAGFEPTTPWFVAKYSIQLSYSRKQACPVVRQKSFQTQAP
jgi:hypothetical protein